MLLLFSQIIITNNTCHYYEKFTILGTCCYYENKDQQHLLQLWKQIPARSITDMKASIKVTHVAAKKKKIINNICCCYKNITNNSCSYNTGVRPKHSSCHAIGNKTSMQTACCLHCHAFSQLKYAIFQSRIIYCNANLSLQCT